MNKAQEIRLFQSLAGNQPHLKTWLEMQKAKQVEVLCKQTDLVALHRAQGHVSLIDTMLDFLEKAPQLPA